MWVVDHSCNHILRLEIVVFEDSTVHMVVSVVEGGKEAHLIVARGFGRFPI